MSDLAKKGSDRTSLHRALHDGAAQDQARGLRFFQSRLYFVEFGLSSLLLRSVRVRVLEQLLLGPDALVN